MTASETQPLARWAAGVARKRFAVLRKELARLAKKPDEDAIHDVRVATRRLRAALRHLRPGFRKAAVERVNDAARSLASLLGQARDIDIILQHLPVAGPPPREPEKQGDQVSPGRVTGADAGAAPAGPGAVSAAAGIAGAGADATGAETGVAVSEVKLAAASVAPRLLARLRSGLEKERAQYLSRAVPTAHELARRLPSLERMLLGGASRRSRKAPSRAWVK